MRALAKICALSATFQKIRRNKETGALHPLDFLGGKPSEVGKKGRGGTTMKAGFSLLGGKEGRGLMDVRVKGGGQSRPLPEGQWDSKDEK